MTNATSAMLRVMAGTAVASAVVAGGQAYATSRQDCVEYCNSDCYVYAYFCSSCHIDHLGGGHCALYGTGCSSWGCQCSGGPIYVCS